MNVKKVWLTDDAVWIETDDGRKAFERFDNYPRLRSATPEQRASYVVGPFGLHWEALDEDLSFEGFFAEKQPLRSFFVRHPEINASGIARRMGIQQSLLAAYLGGQKKPSKKREQEIAACIREVGREMSSFSV